MCSAPTAGAAARAACLPSAKEQVTAAEARDGRCVATVSWGADIPGVRAEGEPQTFAICKTGFLQRVGGRPRRRERLRLHPVERPAGWRRAGLCGQGRGAARDEDDPGGAWRLGVGGQWREQDRPWPGRSSELDPIWSLGLGGSAADSPAGGR